MQSDENYYDNEYLNNVIDAEGLRIEEYVPLYEDHYEIPLSDEDIEKKFLRGQSNSILTKRDDETLLNVCVDSTNYERYDYVFSV